MEEKKSMFTVKKVLRALELICILFVFCPSFLVSCSGQNVNINVMTAVGGVKVYGEYVSKPQPILLICLILPIVALVLLFIKKFADKKTATIVLCCTVVDIVIWFMFRAAVKKYAEANYCTFKTNAWFVFNVIALILIVLLTVLIVINKIQMDSDLITMLSGGGTQGALNQMSEKMSQISSSITQLAGNVASNINTGNSKKNAIGFCSKCGAPIEYGCKFCTGCGTPVPESLIAEAEEARRLAEEKARQEEERRRVAEEKARLEAEARQKDEKDKAEAQKHEV